MFFLAILWAVIACVAFVKNGLSAVLPILELTAVLGLCGGAMYYFVVCKSPETKNDTITIDARGITLLSIKNGEQTIEWSNMQRIVKTIYARNRAMVIISDDAQQADIWFYYNKRIMNKILELYPASERIIEKDSTYRIWSENYKTKGY